VKGVHIVDGRLYCKLSKVSIEGKRGAELDFVELTSWPSPLLLKLINTFDNKTYLII
jgi:hypothetical protein